MSTLRNKYGGWAVVVGAAKGLGEAFCGSLAKRGFNIVMVDKAKDPMMILSERLKEEYGIETLNINIDLFETDSVMQIIDSIKDLDCRLLIYNAAFRYIKEFADHTSEELDIYLNVNINSQIKMIHAFSKGLIGKNQSGGILLMSSLTGLLGMQLVATYSASKAFTWNLAEALYHEFKSKNIDISACVAGPTDTEAYLSSDPQYGFIRPQVQKRKAVAEYALSKLGKKALFISGLSNRINYFILTRLLPRKMASRVANKAMRRMYRVQE